MIDKARTLGTITGDPVVELIGIAHSPGCADGQGVGIVAGSGDHRVAVSAQSIVPSPVAGSHNYDQARPPGGFDRLAERVQVVAFENATAQRQVDDADVVSIL